MTRTLLVANRGEIACRIFRSARRLGWRTVAVFSDADAGARHTREADEAVWIGAAPARESYLSSERLLAAARASGAGFIHPGYGFLSENAAFARACADAGVHFVGPPPAAIAAMGSKIVAKNRMREAGVPVLPGYAGPEQDLGQLAAAAHTVGLPLIIKPAAGGGGKGMQIVRQESELTAALAAARRLAESAFGDGALLLERFLPTPRHLEVQVFGDTHGNLVHLGDRDCSAQRRHQKLLEEAPAPDVPDAVRARLRAAALVVAREIGYVSAGTVEFLYDGREFYFMEMNTRLQVEHTVTEAVTGLDLVEWQLRVATGEPLPLRQEEVRLAGHAIEARVCAEDPERNFLPSAGRLALMQWPARESVRVDAGFESGDTVPDCYDSLLGKVIAWAPGRELAAARLAAALTDTYCAGVRSNERWLARVLRSRRFLEVRHNIALLDKGAAEFAGPAAAPPEALILAALALHVAHSPAEASPWAVRDGFTPNLPATVSYTLSSKGRSHTVELSCGAGGRVLAASVDVRTLLQVADVSYAAGGGGAATIAARLVERRRQARC
ncbi:MAG TPA: biotin carboxylase N-terminal domain-containing protein, partial [Steroidobacteraceae bacterium]|nr:biotin carboxylase N-terminal domain-containing protein [Steroidobacteraceae bacterium]